METKWVDIKEVPWVQGWHCMRSAHVTSDGVDTLVTLTLLDRNEYTWVFVMPVEVAQRIGWDLMGEGLNLFAEVVITAEDDDEDDEG